MYCPYLWDSGPALRKGRPVVFHDPAVGNRRTLDVGVDAGNPGYAGHFSSAHDEQRGEDLRLLYVALTRARHQVVLWWVRAYDSQHSPLGRLLMSRDQAGNVAASAGYAPTETAVGGRLEQLAARVPGHLRVERCQAFAPARWEGAPAAPSPLAVARFGRGLDRTWRRTSYTGITAGDDGDVVSSEPEVPGTTDEPDDGAGSPSPSPAPALGTRAAPVLPGRPDVESELRAIASPLGGIPKGAEVGTFVHAVLEQVDFTSVDIAAAVTSASVAEQSRRGTDVGSVGLLSEGLVAALSTPLGPLVDGKSLRAVSTGDRLDELRFELPLAGGDRPLGRVLTADIADLFAGLVAPGSPLDGYSARLSSPALAASLRGYLTGSLDLVLRTHDEAGIPRFLVVDYKTNWLGPDGEALSAWHYRPDALAAEMQRDHYPLQAILYMVALHRYLRWRMAGYDPGIHLGGVLYLFLRGMTGAGAPAVDGVPCGVFSWPTPPALVGALSDLLDAGSGPR